MAPHAAGEIPTGKCIRVTKSRESRILDQFGNPIVVKDHRVDRNPRGPRSRYDAASTNDRNRRHWENADGLSARAANSPDVRRRLRERARYEADNNGHCSGLIESITHNKIGTGPRLQIVQIPGFGDDVCRWVEREYASWCADMLVDLYEFLRVLDESETRDGECFGVAMSNPNIEHPVQLRFELIETEQCATPGMDANRRNAVDGIEFDAYKQPSYYHILNQHPGDGYWETDTGYSKIPAKDVVHWFRKKRPGQARGIPRITPGLSTLAQVRRYSMATLTAAEFAATIAGVIETDLPPTEETAELEEYDEVPYPMGSLLTMPRNHKVNQLDPKQPTSNHNQFKENHLTEFGRGVHAPKNVVTGDSSGYNFSSARLDWLIFRAAMKAERRRLRTRVNDPVFRSWLVEAMAIPGYMPKRLPPVRLWSWGWQYDGFPSINPVDDANTSATRLGCGLTSYADELADEGKDWQEHFRKLAAERRLARELEIEDLLWPDQNAAMAVSPESRPTKRNTQADVDTTLDEELVDA